MLDDALREWAVGKTVPIKNLPLLRGRTIGVSRSYLRRHSALFRASSRQIDGNELERAARESRLGCNSPGLLSRDRHTCHIRILRNNIRIMRNNSPALSSLFPSVRQGVLAATLTRPEKWWYLSELAEFLHTSPSSLQRELSSLVQTGILQQRRDGRRTYFKAEARSPIFRELRSIFEKTVGLIPTLRVALRSFENKIACAFVYGSIARGEEHATSDVDLMVIGKVGLGDLSPPLRRTENRLGREVNVTCYSVDEFRKKVTEGDHFLRTVLKGSLHFVKGEPRDLDAIAGK